MYDTIRYDAEICVTYAQKYESVIEATGHQPFFVLAKEYNKTKKSFFFVLCEYLWAEKLGPILKDLIDEVPLIKQVLVTFNRKTDYHTMVFSVSKLYLWRLKEFEQNVRRITRFKSRIISIGVCYIIIDLIEFLWETTSTL